jgi:hypothetical protein
MVVEFYPRQALCDDHHHPEDPFHPTAAIPDAVEGEGRHHNHVRTWHPVTTLAGIQGTRASVISNVLLKKGLQNLSPARYPETSIAQTLKWLRFLWMAALKK